MTPNHWFILLHPILAIVFVLPLVGIVSHFAWQTWRRRLKTVAKEKTKISPTAGLDHVRLGRWLAAAVVGLALLGLAHPIGNYILNADLWTKQQFQVILIALMFGITVSALVVLYRANTRLWRGIFAALTSAGLLVLGAQDGVYRRDHEWWISHYYYGIAAAVLMIFSVAILPEIYRSSTWRRVHLILNVLALLLFIGLGITGARDLFEIALYSASGS